MFKCSSVVSGHELGPCAEIMGRTDPKGKVCPPLLRAAGRGATAARICMRPDHAASDAFGLVKRAAATMSARFALASGPSLSPVFSKMRTANFRLGLRIPRAIWLAYAVETPIATSWS